MGHLHADNIVVERIEVGATSQGFMGNFAFAQWLIRVQDGLADNIKENLAQLRGTGEDGAGSDALGEQPAGILLEEDGIDPIDISVFLPVPHALPFQLSASLLRKIVETSKKTIYAWFI